MLDAYKRYFDFQGRASRSEFWLFGLLGFLVTVGFFAVLSIVVATDGSSASIISVLVYGIFLLGFTVGSYIPSLAVTFRRLHDTNRSAWWLLILFIPFVGAVVLLVFWVLPGTPGPNRYGPRPGALLEVFA